MDTHENKCKPPRKHGLIIGATVVVIAAAVVIAAMVMIRPGPDLNGMYPIQIVLIVRSLDTGEEVLRAIVHDPKSCEGILTVLRGGRAGTDHKCASNGSLTIGYADGASDTLDLLAGHDDSRYEFRFGMGLYRVPRARFLDALKAAGVDVSRIPAH
jgi:hypothetical protein